LAEEYIKSCSVLALVGKARELEQALPYQPVIEALRSLLKHPEWPALQAGLRASLPAVWLDEISRLVPELAPAAGEQPVQSRGAGEIDQELVTLHAIFTSAFLFAVLLGVCGFLVMTLAVQYGVVHMPVHRSAVILLFELVVGAVSSLLLTDETVSPREWLGGGMIVAASYLAARLHAVEEAQA
jgi:hypothetical protein